MHDFWDLILILLVLLAAAMALGMLMERLRQSAVVGYMLAGAILGPHAAGLVPEAEAIHELAELGVALLLFSIGLEFSVTELKKLGVRSMLGGLAQVSGVTVLAAGVAMLLGMSLAAAVVIGIIVSMSSTEVVLSALSRRAETDSVHGRFAMAVLLFQDLAVVPAMLLVTALARGGSAEQVVAGTMMSIVWIVLFIVGFFLISTFVLPWVLRITAESRNRELGVIFALVSGLGSAWVAHALGLSPALGAFVAGVFLGESVLATQLRGDVGPFRTIFVTLFFGTIGMFANLGWIATHAWQVALAVLIAMPGKAAVVWLAGRLLGLTHRHAIAAGVATAQLGVFSFVLLQIAAGRGADQGEHDGVGRAAGILTGDQFNLIVSTAIVTLFATPYLVGMAEPVGRWTELRLRRLGLVRRVSDGGGPSDVPASGHVMVVGYGPAGRVVDAALAEAQVPVTIIELNMASVLEARSRGRRAYVGDATHEDVLEHAGVHNARAVVVTLPDHRAAAEAVRVVRSVCDAPITVIARCRYHRYQQDLRDAGAHVVVDEEAAVGRRLAEELRRALDLRARHEE